MTNRISLPRIAFLAVLAIAMGALYLLGESATRVSATPSGPPIPSTSTPSIGVPFTVTASYTAGVVGNAVLTATESGALGSIGSCTDSVAGTGTIVNGATVDTCTISVINTLVGGTVSITYTCAAAGTVAFNLNQGGSTSAFTYVTCGTGFTTGCNPALGYLDPCCTGSLYNTYAAYGTSCYNQGFYNQPGFIPPTYTQPTYTQPVAAAPVTQQVTAPAVQPAYVAPPAITAPIRPPSTGDAGLLALVD